MIPTLRSVEVTFFFPPPEVTFNLSPGIICLITLPSVREHDGQREGFRGKAFSDRMVTFCLA